VKLFSGATQMEKTNLPAEQLCFITVVFPADSDSVMLDVKTKISEAVSALKKVKVETRITEMRDGSYGNNNP